MRDHLRGLAALVFAFTAGGVAWGLTINYTDVTQNDRGASYLGGKTITIGYSGATLAPLASHVYFQGWQVTSLASRYGGNCPVTVNGGAGSGTIDIEVPPRPGGWVPSSQDDIYLDATGTPPPDSNRLDFTYWDTPVLFLQGGQLPGQMQQGETAGEIEITGTGFPEPDPGAPLVPMYGRTVIVDFGGSLSPSVEVYTGRLRVTVPSGTIGSSVLLTVTVDDGVASDRMVAADNPTFTWCPGRPNPPPAAITPSEGPLAGNIDPAYVTLPVGLSELRYDVYAASGTDPTHVTLSGGTNFYYGYTYVSFDGSDGPWVSPAATEFTGTTELKCPLLPQPDMLELQPVIYVMNAYVASGRLWEIGKSSVPLVFYYKDQWPQQVGLTGLSDGAVIKGDVLLQAEAVDDRNITKVEFRYGTGTDPTLDVAPADGTKDYLQDINTNGVPDYRDDSIYPLLGTDTTWPYEFEWEEDTVSFPDGDYYIFVVAYDDHVWSAVVPDKDSDLTKPAAGSFVLATGGHVLPSSGTILVTRDWDDSSTNVDNPPQAQMLVPADGAVFSVDSGAITLSALVADDLGFLADPAHAVTFFVDGEEVGGLTWLGFVDLGTGWNLATATWDGMLWDAGAGADVKAADGPHQITVKVWDTISQSAMAGVTVTVDSSAVSITSITPDGSEPLVGSDLAGADAITHLPLTVTITGDGFVDGDTTVLFGSVPAANMTVDSATQITVEVPNLGLPLSAADGTIDVSVTVSDVIQGDVTQTLSNAFYVEDSDPYVELLGPQLGATVGGTVLLQADARDDSAIASVTYQYSIDGSPASWVTIATVDAATDNYPFSYTLDTAALLGVTPATWYFRAMAVDDGGNALAGAAATIVDFDVDQSTYDNPPLVTIFLPAQGATVGGTVDIWADVTDAEALSIETPGALPRFEIISAGRDETLGTLILDNVFDPGSVVPITNGWRLWAAWNTTEVDGSGDALYPDGSFYLIRAAVTDDATPSSNTGYDAVNVTVQNGVPVIPPFTNGGGGGGGGCAPSDTAAPAASLLLLGTAFLVLRRRRAAPA